MTLPKSVHLLTAALLACLPSHAQTSSAPAPSLQQQVESIAATHHGSVALFATQLATGKTIAFNADRPVQTASTIKLALLWETLRKVAQHQARWDEPLTLTATNDTAGSGILHLLDQPVTLTLKDIATLMVIVSDNTATNVMIDRFPIAQVNADMAAIGLSSTVLYKKIGKPATGPLPADQPSFGLGKTTPRQMAALMERIGRCNLDLPNTPPVDPARATAACAVALGMLRNQFYRDTIPRHLEALDSTDGGSGIASKTGSLDAARSDVAILAGRSGPMILAIYTYNNADHSWSVDNEAERLIATLAQTIVTAWSPTGLDGTRLTPGLGIGTPAP